MPTDQGPGPPQPMRLCPSLGEEPPPGWSDRRPVDQAAINQAAALAGHGASRPGQAAFWLLSGPHCLPLHHTSPLPWQWTSRDTEEWPESKRKVLFFWIKLTPSWLISGSHSNKKEHCKSSLFSAGHHIKCFSSVSSVPTKALWNKCSRPQLADQETEA